MKAPRTCLTCKQILGGADGLKLIAPGDLEETVIFARECQLRAGAIVPIDDQSMGGHAKMVLPPRSAGTVVTTTQVRW